MKSASKAVLESVPELKLVLKLVPGLCALLLMLLVIGYKPLHGERVAVPAGVPCAAGANAAAYASTEELLVSKCKKLWM